MKTTTKIWKKEEIHALLFQSDATLIKGLLRIYSNQTADEQAVKLVTQNNGIGFTGADAPFLTSLAENFLKNKKLSPKQLEALRKKMPKYVGQLTRFANNKI
jgi:hypothetical protein